MSETGPLLSLLWKSASCVWLFRAELLLSSICIVGVFPRVLAALRDKDKRWLWAGVILCVYFALVLYRTGGQFQTFEDWEELYAGKLSFQGDAVGFLAALRHGTTYPFLLAELYRFLGPSPEVAVFLNLFLLAAAPLLVFLAASLLYGGLRAPLAALLLFCFWPGLAEYGVLVQGKPGLVVSLLSAFSLSAVLSVSFPRPASFGLLFLTADLAAKTRQEFGVLYLPAFLIWFASAGDRRKTWWIPGLALLFSIPYVPLLIRGINCHINPVEGIERVSAGNALWGLFPAGLTAAVLAGIRATPFSGKAFPRFVMAAAAVSLSAVYILQPGGPQARLFMQLSPLFCVAAAPAVSSMAVLLPFLVFGGIYWQAGGAPHPEDTPAAMAKLSMEAERDGGLLLLPDLAAASEWKFRGFGALAALDGEARFLRPGGKYGPAGSAGYSVVSGRTVWVAGRSSGNFWSGAYPWLAAAGKRGKDISFGGWRMIKFHFPGKVRDVAGSKKLSDRAVDELLAGHSEKGEIILAEALELNPENTDARLSLAALRGRRGDRAGCLRLAAGTRELMPQAWRNTVKDPDICGDR